MDKASATLGGRELLHIDSVEWPLRPGSSPVMQTFAMAPLDALAIANTGKPVTLEIKPLQGTPVIVSNLWVLSIQPGPNPYISYVLVADRRWFWDRGHVVGNYNCRRNVGVKRILANDLQLDVNFDRAADIAYWRWSLISQTTKYVSLTMLQDVLGKVAKIEKAYWGETFESVLDDRLNSKIKDLSIEELRIDDPGNAAVDRALAYLPEAAITVDYDGKIVVFSRAGGDDIEIVKATMPEIWGKGHVDLVKNSSVRPKEIHVLFTREVEIRFDFVETTAATTGTQTADAEPLGQRRRMMNVVSLPDYQTTINSRTYAQGTWANVDDAMRSWGNLPLQGVTRSLDHDLLQRAFIPEMDLWSALGIAGDLPDNDGTLKPWVGRVAECQLRYRRTFQLNRLWTDRFLSLKAYRLSTIDPQTGQRGPSMAYGDYCLLPSQRARHRNIAQGKPLYYAINKTAYPTGSNEYLDDTALPSPGIVSVVDPDQGVINVDYAMDLNRSYEMVLPSQMQTDSMPTADITQRDRPIAMNEIIEGKTPPRLSSAFKLAVILTAVPASPNSAQQLHRIVVKPSDVAGLLPTSMQTGLSEAKGPIMEVRIGPGVEVARIRWDDSKSKIIEHIFGIDTEKGTEFEIADDPQAQADFSAEVRALCLNEGSTGGKAGASLNEIAKAQAAAIYAFFCDRYEGSMTGYMNGNVHLNGWANEILHQYSPKGETTTRISFPGQTPQMSLHSFLSASERAIVLRLVQP